MTFQDAQGFSVQGPRAWSVESGRPSTGPRDDGSEYLEDHGS